MNPNPNPKINLDPPAGTRDFLPADMRVRNWLFNEWRTVSEQFGFSEYDAPIVENVELYTRKGGDDITKEMFAFTMGNNHLALRPEMTPSVSRMIMKNFTTEPAPFKWFSIPQCWRYEDIKRGRKREHYQWNADVFGAEKITSEIEIFMMITTFFVNIGLTPDDVKLKVSNRMILQKILTNMGVPSTLFEKACVIIDKIKKLDRNEMSQLLKDEIALTDDNIQCIYDLCGITDINLIATFLGDRDETYLEMNQIFMMATKLGIDKWLQFDASIVRGLSYYTGLVFEGFSIGLPNLQKSICGGGRYDDLLTSYGYEKQVPAVGFGFGDVVIIEMLKDLKKLPICGNKTKYLVVPFSPEFYTEAVKISQRMREKNVCTETYTKNTRVKPAYDYADRKGIDNVILIAPTEWADGKIVVKKLREPKESETKQMTVLLTEFINNLGL